MINGPKEWKTPEASEQKRKGRNIDVGMVEEWVAQEADSERKATLQEALGDDNYDLDGLTEILDELVKKKIKTVEDIKSIILPRMAAPFVAYTQAISGEDLVEILEKSDPVEVTMMLVDARHFRGNLIGFKMTEMARRVPDHQLHWAFRNHEAIHEADKTSAKSVHAEIVKEWASRIDSEGARKTLMLDKENTTSLGEQIQIKLSEKLDSKGAAEVLCKTAVSDCLSDSALRLLSQKLNGDDKEFVQMEGYWHYDSD